MTTLNSPLTSGQVLNLGDEVQSPNQRYVLRLQQADGDLVLLDLQQSPPKVLWDSNTANRGVNSCKMQTDGDFVLLGTSNNIICHTATAGYPNAFLAVQDDANVVVYKDWNTPLWQRSQGLTCTLPASVYVWGANTWSQIGNGTPLVTQYSSTQILTLSNVTAIAAGGRFGLALGQNATVWAWGDNYYGQHGNGTTQGAVPNTPGQVSTLSNVTAIAAGGLHGYALKQDGTVWAWGYNGYGQVGIGNLTSPQTTPVRISTLSNVIAIAAGGWHG
jgi:hypothetical protein